MVNVTVNFPSVPPERPLQPQKKPDYASKGQYEQEAQLFVPLAIPAQVHITQIFIFVEGRSEPGGKDLCVSPTDFPEIAQSVTELQLRPLPPTQGTQATSRLGQSASMCMMRASAIMMKNSNA